MSDVLPREVAPACPPTGDKDMARGAAPVVVWGIWFLCLSAALAYIWAFGHNVPNLWEDGPLVSFLSGDAALTTSWLWKQENEHRIPLPKLVHFVLLRLSDGDFRDGNYFNTLTLAALASAMIWTAGRLRGRTTYADAFFPLVLLQGGLCVNLLTGSFVHFVLVTVFSGLLLLAIVWDFPWSLRGGALVLLDAVCLAGCGTQGLVFVPVAVLGLAASGVWRWRSTEPGGDGQGAVLLASALAGLLLLGLPFIGYERNLYAQAPPGLKAVARTALQFLSTPFGHAAKPFWPYSALAVVVAGAFTVALLIWAWRGQREAKVRALLLAAFLTVFAVLGAGVGWGRSGAGFDAGFSLNYVSLTVMALCATFFAGERFGPSPVRPWGRAGLLALAGLIFLANVPGGLRYGQGFGRKLEALERDVREGVPPYVIVHRNSPFLFPTHDTFASFLSMLRTAEVGSFKYLRDDPPFREIRVPVRLASSHGVVWSGRAGKASGGEAYLDFAVPQPRDVAGVRLTFAHANAAGAPPFFKLFWKDENESEFSEAHAYTDVWLPAGQESYTVTVYVCGRVERLRVYPDNKPCDFRVSEIVLLVPDA